MQRKHILLGCKWHSAALPVRMYRHIHLRFRFSRHAILIRIVLMMLTPSGRFASNAECIVAPKLMCFLVQNFKLVGACLVLLVGTGLNAQAQTISPEVVTQVEAYLNGMETLSAEFLQVAPDGSLSTGKFYLKKPGRMRWQYNPPTPLLMVADGEYFIIYDFELEEITHVDLDDTIMSFLARKPLKLASPVVVEEAVAEPGVLRVCLRKEKEKDGGTLTLIFDRQPLQLRQMVIEDAVQKTTQVTLENLQTGGTLDDELFRFTDPNFGRRKRN